MPASTHSSASFSVDSGACSAGLTTTVFPAAMAGAIFHAAICSAKFHGVMAAHTPIGSRRIQFVEPGLRGSGCSSSSRPAISAKTRNVEMTIPMSPPRAVRTVWPASWTSRSTRSLLCFLARSLTAVRYLARSRPFMRGHGPSSKAVRAASVARRASSAFPYATRAITSPVDGSIESNVEPSAASTSSPSMSSL